MRKVLAAILPAVTANIMAQVENDSIWRTISLPEVTVKMKPVEQSKDTVKYNIASFQGKGDRYIEDVLKKLPGVEVSENGSILYKGTAINSFNIEGQNLLGNRYNQATRNLPVEAVAQVQVVENDQPIRALKDIQPSGRATMNIKLKSSYKMRPFGEIQGGIGKSDNTLWNNHLTLINIAQRNQALVTAKMNNTGENLDNNTIEHIDVTDIDNHIPLPSPLVTSSNSRFLPINEKRYLKNKSLSLGLNHTHRLGQYGSLRTNITWYGSNDIMTDSTYHLYGGAHTLELFENYRRKTHGHTIVPQIRYEMNSPRMYLTDELSASLSYTGHGNKLSSHERMMDENVARHPSYIQNKLRMTLNTNGRIYSISSLTRYFHRSETLNITDMTDVYNLYERLVLDRLQTRNSIYTSFILWGNRLGIGYNMEYRSDRMKVDKGDYKNSRYLKNEFSPEYTMRYGHGYVIVKVPFNIFTSSIPWQTADSHKSRYYLSPSIHWRHEFSPFWKLNVRGDIRQDTNTDVLYPDTYHSGYRIIIQTAEQPMWIRSSDVALSLNYADMINMFTWSLTASASWKKSNIHTVYNYQEQYTVVTPALRETNSYFLYVKTSAEKAFTDAGTSLRGTINYTRNSIPIEQNGLFQSVKSNIMSTALTLQWNKLEYLQCTDEATFNMSWQDNYGHTESHTLKSIFNELRIGLYPTKTLTMNTCWEQSVMETTKGKYNINAFIDIGMRYNPSKHLELGLQLNNVLNRRKYIDASFTGFNYRYFSMPLRGREILFTVKTKL